MSRVLLKCLFVEKCRACVGAGLSMSRTTSNVVYISCPLNPSCQTYSKGMSALDEVTVS